jgi:dipeptidase E
MSRSLFLASKRIGGISHVLPAAPSELRTVFVPTAGVPFNAAPWIDKRRAWLDDAGFRYEELELSRSDRERTAALVGTADLIYVEGGNTYFLLEHMQRCDFWGAMVGARAVYSGCSAGAVVACPDIGYVGDLDDRSAAPGLATTAGAGLVPFGILPHMDDMRVADQLAAIVKGWTTDQLLIGLDDDQALVVTDGLVRCVASPDALVDVDQSGTGNS